IRYERREPPGAQVFTRVSRTVSSHIPSRTRGSDMPEMSLPSHPLR
ncbi:hypothetical protein GCK32_019259, partial [Trichostrongylus colubriformis]